MRRDEILRKQQERDRLLDRLDLLKERLGKRQEQIAIYGINVDPSVPMEIKQLHEQIASVKQEITEIQRIVQQEERFRMVIGSVRAIAIVLAVLIFLSIVSFTIQRIYVSANTSQNRK